ncbi:2'-5' RNA ligase family protein [Deinococcus aerophilus]|uniref:2'-5' RNA ligase family protein n=1 Tax=Deinococcus aerophilus TaxID=522488 RepID=UPI00166D65B1|nr:2'-5' RNA ligase family protein [Deinococcus aerophilus]
MGPSSLLALLPPPDLTARIQEFRAAHALRDAAAVPHITVKPRSGLDPDRDWQAPLRAVVAVRPPVRVSVGGARLFGNGSAVYLEVRSAEAVRLHLALLNALRPARVFGYEGPGLQLHLSLALAQRGVELPPLLAAARREFADLAAQPRSFVVTAVTVMRKSGPGGVYLPVEDWPLGAGSLEAGSLGGQPPGHSTPE